MTSVGCNWCSVRVKLPYVSGGAELSLEPLKTWLYTPDAGWLCPECKGTW